MFLFSCVYRLCVDSNKNIKSNKSISIPTVTSEVRAIGTDASSFLAPLPTSLDRFDRSSPSPSISELSS